VRWNTKRHKKNKNIRKDVKSILKLEINVYFKGKKIPVGRDFPHLSRPAMRPIQPPVQWIAGLSRG
jgi:hypothetical protein